MLAVLGDLHVHSLKRQTGPVIITGLRQKGDGTPISHDCRYLLIRLSPGPLDEILPYVEKISRKYDEALDFNYGFVDESLERQYRREKRLANILASFSVIAVVIASLGLFGLATFETEKRTKEIGIRKVLGATVFQVVQLLTKDFAKPVLVANLAAWPLAFFILRRYLQEFPYRISLGFLPFILVSVGVLLFALAVVASHTVNASIRQPAATLRNE